MPKRIAIIVPTNNRFEAVYSYAKIIKEHSFTSYGSSLEVYYFSNGRIYSEELTNNGRVKEFKQSEFQVVILNYTGYGYSKLGLPLYLLKLPLTAKLKRQLFIVIFHELHASFTRPLLLAQVLTFLQKGIWSLIALVSSKNIFTNSIMFEMGRSKLITGKDYLLPLFSNIPVIKKGIIPNNRLAIVFGTLGRRKAVYKALLNDQSRLPKIVDEIIDIGECDQELNILISEFEIKISISGLIESKEVAHYMSRAVVGFIDYPEYLFEKSGVFAAYASYGLCIINTHPPIAKSQRIREVCVLKEGIHYYSLSNLEKVDISYNQNLVDWYSFRTPESAVKELGKIIFND